MVKMLIFLISTISNSQISNSQISNSQIFLLKKCEELLQNAKATHIFSAKILAYINNSFSFEQLGPGWCV